MTDEVRAGLIELLLTHAAPKASWTPGKDCNLRVLKVTDTGAWFKSHTGAKVPPFFFRAELTSPAPQYYIEVRGVKLYHDHTARQEEYQ